MIFAVGILVVGILAVKKSCLGNHCCDIIMEVIVLEIISVTHCLCTFFDGKLVAIIIAEIIVARLETQDSFKKNTTAKIWCTRLQLEMSWSGFIDSAP